MRDQYREQRLWLDKHRSRLRKKLRFAVLGSYACAKPPEDEWQHFQEVNGHMQHVGPCREFLHEPGTEPWLPWPSCGCETEE